MIVIVVHGVRIRVSVIDVVHGVVDGAVVKSREDSAYNAFWMLRERGLGLVGNTWDQA